MATHRKRPVPRHQARTRGGNPTAAQPPDRRLGAAMRRVVVTPTFAAGLGVVVAAVLASQMPTVFNYAEPNGATCKVISCGIGSRAGGQPASGPSRRLNTLGGASTHSGGKGSASAASHAAAAAGWGSTAAPQLSYQTSSRARWGFAGTIVMIFKAKTAHQRWRLQFSYPSGRILMVSAGRYIHVQHGQHTALASWNSPAHATFPRQVRISLEVTGRPGPPRQCSFNGRSCHFGGRRAAQRGAAGSLGHKPTGRDHDTPQGARSPEPANSFS